MTTAVAAKFALAELGLVQVLALQFFGATATPLILRELRSALARGSREAVQGPPLPRVLGGVFVGVVGLAGTIFLQYLAFATAPIVGSLPIKCWWVEVAAW